MSDWERCTYADRHSMKGDHVHSDPEADWRDVRDAIENGRPDWSDYTVAFSPNVDSVNAEPDPQIED